MKLQGSRFVGCIGGSWRDCTFCPFFWYPLRSGGMDFRAGCPFHLFFRYTLRSGGKSDVDCWRNGISFLLTFSVSPSFRCGGIPFLKRGPPLTDGTCSDPHSGWHRPDTEGALLRPGGKHQARNRRCSRRKNQHDPRREHIKYRPHSDSQAYI